MDITLPLIVKRRDADGTVAEILCDAVNQAVKIAKEFRDKGYTEVWMEDHQGRLIDETQLNA